MQKGKDTSMEPHPFVVVKVKFRSLNRKNKKAEFFLLSAGLAGFFS